MFFLLIGISILIFSFFSSSAELQRFLEVSARGGKSLDPDILFWLKDLKWKGIVIGAFLSFVSLFRYFFSEKIALYFEEKGEAPLPKTWEKYVDLLLISFVSLFAELLIIRWLSTEMRIFAYFKNIALISCFLGLGLGVALWKRREVSVYAFPFWFCLFGLTATFLGPRMVFLNPAGAEDYVWGIGAANSAFSQLLASGLFIGMILFMFVWNTRNFLFLGYLVGRQLENFPPLKAYTINILGSLLGIWGFMAISYYSAPPVVWFAICLILFLWFLRRHLKQLIAMGVVSLLFLVYLYYKPEPHRLVWSPYYKITLIPSIVESKISGEKLFHGYSLKVNEDSHQTALDFSDQFFEKYGSDEGFIGKLALELPYKVRAFETALIVGAGTGNDIAAALRSGVKEIDAVEIDPKILQLGQELHPENPYQSQRVSAINDDARSFFKKTKKKYDTIVFGILDSHTQFSNMSNLRLDNYVYTVESFGEAKSLLKPNGVISLTFTGDANRLWMGPRFYQMLTEAFGREPIALHLDRAAFLVGNDFDLEQSISDPALKGLILKHRVSYSDYKSTRPATDDWPFLYLKDKKIPKIYFLMLIFLAGVSFVFAKGYLPKMTGFNGHFFFMGTAFLLIETKSISQLALVFGTTWVVNAVVFSGILFLILLANLYVSLFKPVKIERWFGGLALALVLNYIFNIGSISHLSFILKSLISTAVVLLPIFFAAVIFAISFKKSNDMTSAFGSNLLGTVVGGLAEYASLALGIKSLALIAILFYLLSYVFLKREWLFGSSAIPALEK